MDKANRLTKSMSIALARLGELQSLADSPEEFSRIRREILKSYFATLSAEPKARMILLQENIDDVRALAGTPRRALSEILDMLDDSTNRLRRLLDDHPQSGM